MEGIFNNLENKMVGVRDDIKILKELMREMKEALGSMEGRDWALGEAENTSQIGLNEQGNGRNNGHAAGENRNAEEMLEEPSKQCKPTFNLNIVFHWTIS